MQTDNLAWDWRLGKEWNLVRAGERVWTQRKPAAQSRGTKGQSSRAGAAAASEATEVPEETRLALEHGVVVSYPSNWTVRAFWEKAEDDGESAVVADTEGVGLANLPTKDCAIRLRMRQPKDRFCHGRTDGKAVLLKDWMRNNDFPLHARDRTPVVCLDGEVVAVYPGFLGSKVVAPNDGDADGGRLFLRVVIDRVTL
jgi:hypothetical protein